ncbi:hypothetical protein KR044_001901 [Drosophila immigrans]|nr:hypothetical protein KR044_001901 [Drosophila immigrans]
MLINLKVKTLDARTHEFSIDNEITIRQFKDQIAEKTNIAAENQRIIYQGRVLADDKQVKEYGESQTANTKQTYFANRNSVVDVDGKVLHVAERPPFSQRGANATNNDEPQRGGFRNLPGRPAPRNLRNSPYFRALDGMLVGTMAIPVNNDALNAPGTRTPPNRFPNSSSFCINRITVALHMIDCANNIAAYLENPEVGLNNQSLDILQRGRWTMESTVVEVGVSSTDNPRNNNIIDMVQDAVNAALSRNTPGRNYTVVQLPTVYTNEAGGDSQQAPAGGGGVDAAAGGGSSSSDASEEPTAAAAVIIEDVIVSDDEAADDMMPGDDDEDVAAAAVGAATAAAAAAAATQSAGPGDGSNVAVTGIGPRRRTRPQVLANVIQRYRTVQMRLAPFVDRYYEILEQDPAFEEGSEDGARDSAQRIFDRVSEAFHYLSHAQHAISDLMLDLSQPGPRVLTCRPILVEQSGYIRSNNMFTANLPDLGSPHPHPHPAAGSVVAIPINSPPNSVANVLRNSRDAFDRLRGRQQASQPPQPPVFDFLQAAAEFGAVPPPSNEERDRTAAYPAPVGEGRPPQQPANDQQQQQPPQPPVFDFLQAAAEFGEVPSSSNEERDRTAAYPAPVGEGRPPQQPANDQQQRQPPQPPVFDFLEAAAEFAGAVGGAAGHQHHIHHMPNIVSINLPVHLMATTVHPQGRPAAAAATAATAAPAANDADNAAAVAATAAGNGSSEATGAASTSGGTRSAGEQRANTLPTTATQTRSTARPQIQIGGNNNWAGRIAPTHTAFDRFLPCNSHHIREPAPLPQNNNTNTNNNNNNTNTGNNNASSNANSTNNARSNRRAGDMDAASIVISRLARGRGTLDLSRARRRVSNSSSNNNSNSNSNRARSLPGLLASAGGGGGGERNIPAADARSSANANASSSDVSSRQQPSANRPVYSRRARLIEALSMLDNLLVTNVRNHAHAALGGIADVAVTVTARLPETNAASTLSSSSSSSSPPSSSTEATTAAAAGTDTAADSSSSTGTTGAPAMEASNLRAQLRSFLHHRVFEGSPINEETIPIALERVLGWFNHCLLYLPQYDTQIVRFNSRESVRNILRHCLRQVIELCNEDEDAHFRRRITELRGLFRHRLFSVLTLCLGLNAELYWRQMMRLLCVPLQSTFRGEALDFLYILIDPEIPLMTDSLYALQFMVERNAESTPLAPPPLAFPTQQSQSQLQSHQLPATMTSLDSDVEMADVASSSNISSATEREKPLPDVAVGSQPWHSNFPNDWLPVITRDLQTQTEQNRPQPPYSDAYISGMSAKRRKIIQTEKPSSSVECLIASGVQRAIQSTGLSVPNGQGGGGLPAVNPDLVIGAIAHDAVVQAAYTEAVRTNARERIKQDNDYKPSKYPQIAKFTEQK